MNKKIYFVTNVGAFDRQFIQAKLLKRGIKAELNNIMTSCSAAPLYIKSKYPEIESVVCAGSDQLIQEVRDVGLNVSTVNNIPEKTIFQDLTSWKLENNEKAVIMGFDKDFNYMKLFLLSIYLQRGLKFICTNPDFVTMVNGYRCPGNGSLVKMLEIVSEVEPQFVGKPNPFMFEYFMERDNLKREDCLMIGDNLKTDILFGQNSGIDTTCVLTGVTKEEDIKLNLKGIMPKYYCETLA